MYRYTKIGHPLSGPWLKAWSCVFLDYILQLIGILRSRGASGGQQISSLLNGGEVTAQSK
jgi:hypothetical protein